MSLSGEHTKRHRAFRQHVTWQGFWIVPYTTSSLNYYL